MCAIDFSPASSDALEAAAEMTAALGAELVLVHVVDLADVPASERAGLAEAVEAELELSAEEARSRGVSAVQTKVLSGPTWHELVNAAQADPEIEMILLGATGRSALRRVFMGSVAEHVMRHALCSVSIIRRRA